MRQKLDDYISKLGSKTELVDKKDFFGGNYSTHPKQFEFSIGDRQAIKAISIHVEKFIDSSGNNSGLKHFYQKRGRTTNIITNLKWFSAVEGYFFTHTKEISSPNKQMISNNLNKKKEQKRLFADVKKKLAEITSTKISQALKETAISIYADEDTLRGTICCPLCTESKNMINVCAKAGKVGKKYWTLSNFITHITVCHHSKMSLERKKRGKKAKEVHIVNACQETSPVNKKPNKNKFVEEIEFIEVSNHKQEAELKSNTNQNVKCGEEKYEKQIVASESDKIFENESDEITENESDEIDENESDEIAHIKHDEIVQTKPCEFAKYDSFNMVDVTDEASIRGIIFRQMTDQLTKMTRYKYLFDETERSMEFHLNDTQYELDILKVSPDGSCLFRTAAHQLFGERLNGAKQSKKTVEMRNDVVAFINNNYDKFDFELTGRMYEEFGKDVKNIPEKYKHFVKETLLKKSTWGGSESIKAISLMHSVNILVINEYEDCYYVNGFDEKLPATIFLAYRLVANSNEKSKRVHYDSVIDIEEKVAFEIAKKLANRFVNRIKSLDVSFISLNSTA